MPSLSVVIVAKDEERSVGKVLAAIKDIADEIVFVDSGSTDKTIEIASSYGVALYHQEWLGFGAQKNFAIGLAKCDWILSLDADEIISNELHEELVQLLKSATLENYYGYKIPRLLYIGETPVKHGGFYPDAQLRLIKRGKGAFNDRLVHEAIKVAGPVATLKHPIHHYAYRTVLDFNQAMDKYARLSASEYARQGRKGWSAHPLNELVHPVWTLFYRYVVRLGFIDGALGWQLNSLYSDYVRRKIRYLREELVNR